MSEVPLECHEIQKCVLQFPLVALRGPLPNGVVYMYRNFSYDPHIIISFEAPTPDAN